MGLCTQYRSRTFERCFERKCITLLLFSICLLGFPACLKKHDNIPEPNYQSHVLKPGRYTPSQGKYVSVESVPKPKYIIPKKSYRKAGKPHSYYEQSNYHRIENPRYFRTQVRSSICQQW